MTDRERANDPADALAQDRPSSIAGRKWIAVQYRQDRFLGGLAEGVETAGEAARARRGVVDEG
jgi:hypothetical protein